MYNRQELFQKNSLLEAFNFFDKDKTGYLDKK
jgi:Ca2+-binding EF-hand superfamily protein